jgi:hypothetical protein
MDKSSHQISNYLVLLRNPFILFFCATLLIGSCKSSTDKKENELINNDIAKATKAIASDKVLLYKMVKVAAKVIGSSDSSNAELKEIITSLNQVNALKVYWLVI